MSQKTDAVVASTIGIDTGKNTLHLIGLDDQGTIVLRISRRHLSHVMAERDQLACHIVRRHASLDTDQAPRHIRQPAHNPAATKLLTCQAVPPGSQERLPGRLCDRRSCAASINALRSGKD